MASDGGSGGTRCDYEVLPRAPEVGGGWRLRLLQDGVEVGGGVYPADPMAAACTGIAWWNCLDGETRREWMRAAGDTGRVVDAYGAYLRNEAHCEAMDAGDAWILSL